MSFNTTVLFFIIIALSYSCTKPNIDKFEGCYFCNGQFNQYERILTDSGIYTGTFTTTTANDIEICIDRLADNNYQFTYKNDSLKHLSTNVILNPYFSFTTTNNNSENYLYGNFNPRDYIISLSQRTENTEYKQSTLYLNCTKK